MSDDLRQRADELVEAGRFLHSRGWTPATSGNFSARLSDGRIAVTVSGKHKGNLCRDDIMVVDGAGKSLDGRRPSAETLLHTTLYERLPQVGAVLHPHSPSATILSRLKPDQIVLENYELLKAFPDIDTHDAKVVIPIFPNDQDIRRLANRVLDYIGANGEILGYIIAGHGFYTWGITVQDALRHVEALEFLFDLEVRLHGVVRV